MLMKNIPSVKPAIIAVSRDCFPRTLSERRRRAVVEACRAKGVSLFECNVTVETEREADAALAASLFHYGELTVGKVKEYLNERGVPVRLTREV